MRPIDLLQLVPWRHVMGVVSLVRSIRPHPWPTEAPSITVEAAPGQLEWHLRSHHFEGTPYASKYRGQVLDLRRPTSHEDHPGEVHVRARPTSSGHYELVAHLEYSRYERPKRHVHSRDLTWLPRPFMYDLLAEVGLEHTIQ